MTSPASPPPGPDANHPADFGRMPGQPPAAGPLPMAGQPPSTPPALDPAARRRSTERLVGWLLLVPVAALWLFQLVIPSIRLVVTSTTSGRFGDSSGGSVGGANYAEIAPDVMAALGRSIVLGVLPLLLAALIGPVVGSLVAQAGRVPRLVARGLLAVPLAVYTPVGFATASSILVSTGLRQGEAGVTTVAAVIVAGSYVGFGTALLATLLLAVARPTAGRTPWSMIGGVAGLGACGAIGLGLQVYDPIYVATRGGPARTTTTLMIGLLDELTAKMSAGTSAAGMVLVGVVIALLGLIAVVLLLVSRVRLTVEPREARAPMTQPGPAPTAYPPAAYRPQGPPPAAAPMGTPGPPLPQPAPSPGFTHAPAPVPAPEPAPEPQRTGAAGVIGLVLVALGALGALVSGLPALLPRTAVPQAPDTTLATLLPSLLTALLITGVATLAGFAIGWLRPAGRRSEWLLLALSPWLFGSIALLLPVLLWDLPRDTVFALIAPQWCSVPAIVALTYVFAAARRARDAGVRSTALPVLGGVGLVACLTWVLGAQQLVWPLMVSTDPATMTGPLLNVWLHAQFGLTTDGLNAMPATVPLWWVFLMLVLIAGCLILLDRLRPAQRAASLAIPTA